ncbi:hypothetical protein DRN74_04370 [Candidatus Micrarchaeota archaeon]|nr:MAG: hypothetical protein DRN74_04370 [Candidatus Micrarchaeota archaeon]
MSKRKAKPKWIKEIAKKRILSLLEQAKETVFSNSDRTKRYVELALALSKKYNVSIGPDWKKHVCKNCHTVLIEGFNLQVRTSKKTGTVIYKCKECGAVKRYPYKGKVFIKEKTLNTTH